MLVMYSFFSEYVAGMYQQYIFIIPNSFKRRKPLNRYEQAVEHGFQVADTILTIAQKPLFVVTMVVNEEKQVVAERSGWAGGEPTRESRGPHFGPWKARELIETIGLSNELIVCTPVQGYRKGCGFRGGVRRMFDGYYYISACSGWEENADLLMALTINYAMIYGNHMRLHHVGIRHARHVDMLAAVARDVKKYGHQPRHMPTEDHARFYIQVDGPDGPYWVEHQWFYSGDKKPGFHVDFATQGGLLDYLGAHLGVKPQFWQDGSDQIDPMGMVSVIDRDNTMVGVMKRQKWTDVAFW